MSNTDTRPKSVSRGIIGKMEQWVLDVPYLWERCSEVQRYILIMVVVSIGGLISPSCTIGNYRLILTELAQGVAVVACLLAGPRYAISAFFAFCLVYSIKGYVILNENAIVSAAIAAFSIGVVCWLMRRWKIGVDIYNMTWKPVIFGLTVVLFLVCVVTSMELFGISELIESQSVLGGTFSFKKLFTQIALAPMLGIAFALAIGHPLQEKNARGAFVFVRGLMLAILGLVVILVVFTSQLVSEEASELARLDYQAANIKNTLEQQLSLALRSVCNFEYSAIERYLGTIDDAELRRRCAVVKDDNTPWSFVECIVADPASPTKYSNSNTDRFRMAALVVADNLPFEKYWKEDSYVDNEPGFKIICKKAQSVNWSSSELLFNNRFILFQEDDNFMVERCCVYNGQTVGYVVAGISAKAFVRQIMKTIELEHLGVTVYYRQVIGDGSTALVTCYTNSEYEPNEIFACSNSVSIDCGKMREILNITVTGMYDRGWFLLRCLEDFEIYLACLIIIICLANGVFNQYCIVDERALAQVQAKDVMDKRYELIVNNISDCVVITDMHGVIVNVNRVAASFLGQAPKDLVGKGIHALIHPGLPCLTTHTCPNYNHYVELHRRVAHGESIEDLDKKVDYVPALAATGETSTFRVVYVHLRSKNGGIEVVSIASNVDAKLRMQKLRNDYVATLSHDMRTPLACIKGTLEMFAKYAPKMIDADGVSAKGQEMLDVGKRNVWKLNQLVDDVLLSDSVENDSLRIKRVEQDVAPIVRHVIKSLNEQADAQGLSLVTGILEGRANVDAIRLDQVLSNLISNAIKYSRKDGEVLVDARIHPAEQAILFRVQDKGVGIPAEKLPTIFDRYEVVNNDSTRMYGGMGLGLYICRGLVKAHGGDIWVDSVVNQGTTFYFTLPQVVKEEEVTESYAR